MSYFELYTLNPALVLHHMHILHYAVSKFYIIILPAKQVLLFSDFIYIVTGIDDIKPSVIMTLVCPLKIVFTPRLLCETI